MSPQKNGDARCEAEGGGSCLRGAWGEPASGVPGSESIDRSTVRYTSARPDDTPLREAMKAVAAERRRFGYRSIHIMLDRQGIVINQKKLRRLYREEKLQVRRRGGRKRALGTRRPMLVPDRADARWSLDFISDTFTDGRRFRVLAVVDDHTRECLALIADTSLSGLRVARELDAIIRRRARPDTIVSDNVLSAEGNGACSQGLCSSACSCCSTLVKSSNQAASTGER
jgi:transposase InsO family protein